MEIPASYRGREQALVKHRLLESYLERLIMIVGQQKAPRICYVDGFAGPWQEGTSDLEDTSIAVSLRIMVACREFFVRQGWTPPEFRALFIEKDAAAFQKLTAFLANKSHPGLQAQALHGEFLALRQDILRWCGNRDFVFFFIDPTGWKDIAIPELRPLLSRTNSEFLINFMYNFINFTLPQEKFSEAMQDLLGSGYRNLPKNGREKAILRLYRENLKQAVPGGGAKPRTAYHRVLHPRSNRTWYDLVYLTRHPRGVQVFMEVSEKIAVVQDNVRQMVRDADFQEKHGFVRQRLPGMEAFVAAAPNHQLLDAIQQYWLTKLTDQPRTFSLEDLADMLEETDWYIGDVQRGLKRLLDEKRVTNLDAKRQRRTNHVKFDGTERLARLR